MNKNKIRKNTVKVRAFFRINTFSTHVFPLKYFLLFSQNFPVLFFLFIIFSATYKNYNIFDTKPKLTIAFPQNFFLHHRIRFSHKNYKIFQTKRKFQQLKNKKKHKFQKFLSQ